jgi:PEGA domain
MRSPSVAAVSMTLALLVAAQSAGAQSAPKRYGSGAPPAPTVTRPSAPRPPERPAQPPATTTPAPSPERAPFAANPATFAPRSHVRPRRFRSFSPDYGYAAPFSSDDAAPAVEPHDWPRGQLDAIGTLQLEVEPRSAQVYVDGFYLGTVEDFERTGMALPVGRHRVDLREPGHETMTIPVEITAWADGQPTRFRGVLQALRPEPPPVVLPHRSETMYVIPGCYAGNRPPRQSSLAQGCDLALLKVLN